MRRQRILEQWNSYSQEVIPAAASGIQKQEMKRAFYAGAYALNAIVMNGLTPGPGSTLEDESFLIDLSEELQEFNHAVKQGRA